MKKTELEHAPIIEEIINKYEVPKELTEALWDAYTEGLKKGFILGGIVMSKGTANEKE